MTESERKLLLTVAKIIARLYPEESGSKRNELNYDLHTSIRAVENPPKLAESKRTSNARGWPWR